MFGGEDIRHKNNQTGSRSKSQPKQQQVKQEKSQSRSKPQPKQQNLPRIQNPTYHARQENLEGDILTGPRIVLPNSTIRTKQGTTSSTLFRQEVTVDRYARTRTIERVQVKCHLTAGGELRPTSIVRTQKMVKRATRKDLERTDPNAAEISPGQIKKEIANNSRVADKLLKHRMEDKRRLKVAMGNLSEKVLGEIGLRLEGRLNEEREVEICLNGKYEYDQGEFFGDGNLLLTSEANRQVNLITDNGTGYKRVLGTMAPFAHEDDW